MRQNGLAGVIGCSPGYLSQIEDGGRVPSIGFFDRICEGLGVPAAAMICEGRLLEFWDESAGKHLYNEEVLRLTDLCEYYRKEYNYTI